MNANYYRCPPNCNTSRQGVRLAHTGGRRAATDPPTFQQCQPQAPRTGDAAKYQFKTLEECKAAGTACFGPNKAYSYVCGADASQPPQIAYSPDGKALLTEVNCYDCTADNQCAFAGGTGNTSYNTMQACNDDPDKKCGWMYGCTA